jgi:hypothetical protein
VALVRERFNPDLLTNQWESVAFKEVAVANGTYSLQPTLGDFLSPDYKGSHVNIIMYQDQGDPGLQWEPRVWPQESIWFNTWGGQLKVGKPTMCEPGAMCPPPVEQTIIGGETVTGPSFTSDPFNGGGYMPPTTGPGYVPPATDPGGYVPPTTDPGGYVPPTTGGGYMPPVDSDLDRIADDIEANAAALGLPPMDPQNPAVPQQWPFDCSKLPGTWGSTAMGGVMLVTIVATAPDGLSGTYTASFTPPAGSPEPAYNGSGTWVSDGAKVDTIATSSSDPGEPLNVPMPLAVVFLDAAYSQIILDLGMPLVRQ